MIGEKQDSLTGPRYDYIHLPLDHQTHKNMSLAFLNFADQEAAVRAFSFLSRPSDFPEAFAPSTKVVWGAIHGLGPNLAHFIARYGIRALDPPFAPLVFENGVCVPRSQDILRNLGDLSFLGIGISDIDMGDISTSLHRFEASI